MPERGSVDIVVPVYNEEASIARFIERVAAVGLRHALIVIDNASTDRTLECLARYPDIRVLRHASNMGYGASIRDGLLASTAASIVIIDADLEYPPEQIPDLVNALARHPAVYGSRFAAGASITPWYRRHGNALMTGAFNWLFGQQLTDLYTGMKALRREVLPHLSLRRDGFDHVAELAVDLALARHRIAEVPVTYTPRVHGTSKMRHVPETLRGILYLLRARLASVTGTRR